MNQDFLGNHYWSAGYASSQAAVSTPLLLSNTYNGLADIFHADGAGTGRNVVALNTGSTDGLKIGARRDGPAEYFLGDIAEVIVYDQALGAAARSSIEQYLAAKYGLSVAAQTRARPGVFSYSDFSDVSDFTLNGNASQSGTHLRVTPATGSQRGSAFLSSPVAFYDNYEFQTEFAFEITSSGGSSDTDGPGADGLLLVIHNDPSGAGLVGSAGAGMGLDGAGIAPFVAIEIDTWPTGSWDLSGNTSGNHLAIDTSESSTSIAQADIAGRLNDGEVHYLWVDYDGSMGVMDLFLSDTDVKPAAPALSTSIDLASIFDGQTDLYVGFTSGTGGAYGNHDVLAWSFASVPEPSALMLLALGGLGLAGAARRRRRHDRAG